MKVSYQFGRIRRLVEWKPKRRPNTMNRNAVHMLRSVRRTIGDSFIITTEDGKVIVIDGGSRKETGYFIAYLKAATGQKTPHIDAWFLSHPHDDHCNVFLDVVEHYGDLLSFDRVYADFAEEPSFYEGSDNWAVGVLTDYYRLLPRFADKAVKLKEGDVFNVGAARFTALYTFNPNWKEGNAASTVMRMDLGGKSVMFTGDANVLPGNYVVEKYGESGLLQCDICKMAHHGQDGVDKSFYEAVAPAVCLWPTPSWVWNNRGGKLKTPEVRGWIESLGVKENHVAKDGSCVILL
ncbi:MAG: MBL fold metallo-hydrolase [Clostridia bacterium]|nr:MBL fold metallo-hydrolase [Clostridia bacterium]